MGDEEDVASLTRLTDLVESHPDLDASVVQDILNECNQDHTKAYEMLCEMVIPPDREEQTPDSQRQPTGTRPKQTIPQAVHFAGAGVSATGRPEYDSIFQSSSREQGFQSSATEYIPDVNPEFEVLPRPASTPVLQGAWAQKSMGRKYRVDDLCSKYEWISRSVVDGLFDKYGDCMELVEADILQMFPIDEPQAFGGGRDRQQIQNGKNAGAPAHTWSNIHLQSRGSPHHNRQKAIAESLRQQAAEEIHRDSQSAETISLSSKGMAVLRAELWETRVTRMRLQQLANQTRKATHMANAKAKDAELRRLSAFFLDRMRKSEEYKNGVIDLHGLTKEESLQLVEWKLQDSGGRRFRVITGKGIHSNNGQAVLRPALEKYFRGKGISVSACADGVLSVVP